MIEMVLIQGGCWSVEGQGRQGYGWMHIHPVAGYSPTLVRHGLRDVTLPSTAGTLNINFSILQDKGLQAINCLRSNSNL